ncbi:uncharacterized protein LOC126894826 isoform X2 [Daktulosphaira vitifoliae]|uniref:uncharacterized protein LOC126894826 isoform X2 n=1 Tax=Daktulosphaira vitifoliae TaxID=58002 RepID=UPI0021AA7BDF|nr:uncharacterized protein LOC126894826 isoform X2 [Daktulosphaira vitifoliae]
MNPHFIKFVTLYFILSKALSSSIITSEENNDGCAFCPYTIRPGFRYYFHTKCCDGRICDLCYELLKKHKLSRSCKNCKKKGIVSVYKEPVEVPCVICNENKPNRNISSKCLHYYCKKCTREKILANEWCTLCAEYLDTSILISCLN